MNRLLDRGDEAARPRANCGTARGRPPASCFDALAGTLPEVALIHHADDPLRESCGGRDVRSGAGQPDRQADHRSLASRVPRGHAQARQPDAESPELLPPFEVQLISNDEQGIWAELHSRRSKYEGEPRS
jgi:hypothetical protein